MQFWLKVALSTFLIDVTRKCKKCHGDFLNELIAAIKNYILQWNKYFIPHYVLHDELRIFRMYKKVHMKNTGNIIRF